MSTHVLRPRPPLRAFAVAAGLALAGIGLFAAPDLFGWPEILRGVGVAVVLLGLVFLALGVVAMRRMRVEVVLDPQGYRVVGPSGTQSGTWQGVVRVARANQQVILDGGDGTRTVIALPRGGAGDLNRLADDIARQLDANRGYGGPIGLPGAGVSGEQA
ncbi:MAG: hypothetical protein AAGC63_02040 [Propionicimonas sp.]|nr:hypothetical protein [Propionicimonas sp.]